MTTGLPQNLPPPQSPFVDTKTGVLSNDGYQFLMNFINQVAQIIPTATVATVAAAGLTQATATPLQDQWNVVSSQQSGGFGVLLESYEAGQTQIVFNDTLVNVNVYPPPGAAINGNPANAPDTLTAGSIAAYRFFTADDIRS